MRSCAADASAAAAGVALGWLCWLGGAGSAALSPFAAGDCFPTWLSPAAASLRSRPVHAADGDNARGWPGGKIACCM